jgi:hypothetical protein
MVMVLLILVGIASIPIARFPARFAGSGLTLHANSVTESRTIVRTALLVSIGITCLFIPTGQNFSSARSCLEIPNQVSIIAIVQPTSEGANRKIPGVAENRSI